jgi:hypothetical protein
MQTRATENTRMQGGPDADAMTTDNGSTLCNRDIRVESPDALQCLLKFLVAGSDDRRQVWTPPMQIRV